MTMKLSLKNLFPHLILNPLKAEKKKNKVIALITSMACGVFSLGICHAACAIRQHSYAKGRKIIQYYLYQTKGSEQTNEMTDKTLALFDQLATIPRGKGTYVSGIERGWIERLRKANVSIQSVAPDGQTDIKSTSHRLPKIPPDDLPKVTSRLLFQVLADEFGKESTFGGIKSEKLLHYVLSYMKKRCENDFPICNQESALIYEIEEAYAIEVAPNMKPAITHSIDKAFLTNRPCLIPGGWVGLPAGHSIYFEVIPEEGGKASFRIFNTGSGSSEHPQFQRGIKNKVAYIEWKGISQEKLLDPHFATIIEEMQTRVTLTGTIDNRTEYNYFDVYHGLRNFLNVNETDSLNENASKTQSMQKQRGKTCGYRSLMAFIKTKMSTNDFRRFLRDIEIQVLNSNLFSKKGKVIQTKHWRLIDKSAKRISRKIEALYRNKFVGVPYLQDTHEILKTVFAWVEQNHPSIIQKKPFIVEASYEPLELFICINSFPQPIVETLVDTDGFEIEGKAASHLLANVRKFSLSNPKCMAEEIKNIRLLLEEAYSKGEYSAVNFAALDFAKRLDSTDAYWKEVPGNNQAIENMMADCNGISDILFTSSYRIPQANTIFAEKVYSLSKLYFVQKIFAQRLDPSILLTCPLQGIDNTYFQFQDEKMHCEWLSLMANNSGLGNKLFDLNYSYKHTDDFFELNISDNDDKQPVFAEIVRSKYPKTIASIRANNKRFDTSSRKAQDCYIYTSSFLPSWLKNLRDMQLRALHIATVPVVQLHNERGSLQFQFSVDNRGIKIRMEGLDTRHYNYLPQVNRRAANYRSAQLGMGKQRMQQVIAWLEEERDVKKQILVWLQGQCPDNEKKLLSERMKEKIPGFSEEASKELLHIFASNSYRIIEVIEYFTRYPEKLQDVDYQQIFQIACFGHIQEVKLNSINESAPAMLNFLKKQLVYWQEQNDKLTVVFILRMGRYFNRYQAFDQQLPDEGPMLKKNLENADLTPEEKSLIYAEQIAYFGEKSLLSSEELTDLLIGSIWISEASIPLRWKDPKTEWEAQRAIHTHSKAIENHILPNGKPNEKVLQDIYRAVRDDAPPVGWKALNQTGEAARILSTNNDYFEPLKGRLLTLHKETYLPLEIREVQDFQQLFPGQCKGKALPGDVYTFTDIYGNSVVIKKTQNDLLIEQERKGKWYRYAPSTSSSQLRNVYVSPNVFLTLDNFSLTNTCMVWHAIQDPSELILVKQGTDKEAYRVEIQAGVLLVLERLSDGSRLGKPSSLFSHIEAEAFIHEWYDGKECLREIELPRFGLSFKPDAENPTQLDCCQYPGWAVSMDQNFAALGTCNYFLVLTNREGNKRVLIPDQELKAPLNYEVLVPLLERKQFLEHNAKANFSYFIYEIDSDQFLKTPSREGYLHLIETLAVHQEYEQAANYLRAYGEKLSPYSPQEYRRLQKICQISTITGDCSGEQNGIALYAAYLLETNPAHTKESIGLLFELYKNYLIHFKDTTALKLKKEEEVRIVKNLLAIKFDSHFFTRLRELDPSYTCPIYENNFQNQRTLPSYDLYRRLENLLPSEPSYPRLSDEIEAQALLTRSGKVLKEYIFDYVTQAIEGTPEQKKWLRDTSLFLRHQSGEDDRALSVLFEKILENPSKFVVPPTPYEEGYGWMESANKQAKIDELHDWWKKTIKQLEGSMIPTLPSHRNSTVPNITPDYFRLENEHPFLPEIPFSFDLCKISALAEQTNIQRFFIQMPQTHLSQKNNDLKNWLAVQRLQIPNEDSLQLQEWDRLMQDQDIFESKSPKPIFRLNAPVALIKQSIQEHTAEVLKTMTVCAEQMIQMANQMPVESMEQIRYQLREWGGLQKKITLDDIFISFAQKNPKILLMRNQKLKNEDIFKLYSLASTYLQAASLQQQTNRCMKICQHLESVDAHAASSEKQEIEKTLYNELHAERVYNPLIDPAYLVFEYYADVILHKEQIEKIEAFLKGDISNPVMEIIMGFGKSKILLPLLGLLRADGQSLSLLIVPAPLFESIANDTQHILKTAFSKTLRSLHFDRNTTFTKRSLEEIRDILKEVIEQKECLIMTSKSIQSLLLKFLEYADTMRKNGSYLRDEMVLMEEIVGLFHTCGSPLIDEADTVLNVLHEVSFSLGNKASPNITDIRLISKFYRLLLENPHLRSLAKLESDPNPDENAPPLTEEIYYQSLQRPLAEAFLAVLKEKGLQDTNLDQELQIFFSQAKDKELLLDYLCRNESEINATQTFFNALPPKIKDVFALAGEELSHLLPHTLLRMSDENYGLDNDVIAIPYAAVATPSHGSVFSNPYITMNYTFQIHLKKGIETDTIINFVQKLKKQADQEIAESEGTKNISDTDAWKIFCTMKGELEMPLLNQLSKPHLDALKIKINNSIKNKLNVIVEAFLPRLELFEKKLSCNPIGFTALFPKVCGFTGTLWNAGSMHDKITPVPTAGTDARTLSLLWEMSNHNNSVQILSKKSLDYLLDEMGTQPFDLIADAGGYFKEGGNLSIARKLALKFGKPVVFYDSRGEQTMTDGLSERPLKEVKVSEEDRLTFLDQSRTTGADVKQKGDAIGIVTIGRNMLLRDLLQSVWRLRGLEKGQKVRFLIDREVESIVRQKLSLNTQKPLGFPDILKFVIQNQSKQQGNDNFKAFKQQVWNLPQNMLLDVMLNREIPVKLREKAFKYLRKTWIKPANSSPSILYGSPGTKRPCTEVAEEEGEKCKKFLAGILKKLPQLHAEIIAATAQIDRLIEENKNNLHAFIISPLGDEAETVEVEQETQVENEVEIETQSDGQHEIVKLGYCESRNLKQVQDLLPIWLSPEHSILNHDGFTPVFPMEKMMQRDPKLHDYASLFKGILISMNVLEWAQGENNLANLQLLGPNRTPFHHLLVENDSVKLMSLREEISSSENYYNLYLGFKDLKKQPSDKAFEKIVKLKFLNGECKYNKREIEFLEHWISSSGVEKMYRLFTTVVLNNQPDKGAAFIGSSLQKLFKKYDKEWN
jgi:hypothetical protein